MSTQDDLREYVCDQKWLKTTRLPPWQKTTSLFPMLQDNKTENYKTSSTPWHKKTPNAPFFDYVLTWKTKMNQ